MVDYDPMGDAPGLRQILAANPSLSGKAQRYLTDFIYAVEAAERAERRPLFADLWATADQADTWAAEKAQTKAAATAANPRL